MSQTAAVVYNGCNGNNFPHHIAAQLEDHLAKRNEGRMSQFSLEKATIILNELQDGSTVIKACEKAGVSRPTFQTWKRLSPEFLTAVAIAQEDKADAMVDDNVVMLEGVDVVSEDTDPRRAMAMLRKAEQIARFKFDVAKSLNFKQWGDKKQNLNVNLNAAVSDEDVKGWFNK